jgi:tRNA pseudouridine38-40 synthase
MVVAYDGTAYAGWQVQPGAQTIQGAMEAALKQVTGEPTRVQCSGRTDASVHAIGQVAHFDLAKSFTLDKLQFSLNAVLPEDIRVLALRRARPDFHARFSPKGKEYRYFIWNNPVMPPHLRHYHYLVRKPLDVVAMRCAAKLLVGKQDFAAFSANPNREISGTVRHLHGLAVTRRGHEIVIRARGDGFLYKMVRSLAGFLIRVGAGDLPPESARTILDAKLRTATVPTAPPQGLFLWKVFYSGQKK